MSRLTITLSEARYRALKEASAQRGKTIGQLIDESLEFSGIKSREDALELVRRARARCGQGARAELEIVARGWGSELNSLTLLSHPATLVSPSTARLLVPCRCRT